MARGLEYKHEVNPHRNLRDARRFGERINDWFGTPLGAGFTLMILGGSTLFFPSLADVALVLGLLQLWYIRTRKQVLPFRIPLRANLIDFNDLAPGTKKPRKSRGIFFLGNQLSDNSELWLANEDMRTHMLIFGTTGAGKTEMLVSLAFNALVQASGFIYVDGKGDSALFVRIFSVCRFMGREDDLLVINYMTGNRDIDGPQPDKMSNTTNPFSSGSSDALTNLLVSLMDEAGGDGAMWKGRAESLMTGMMLALVSLRNQGKLLLDVNAIREFLPLDKVIELYKRPDLSEKAIGALKAYLESLPGYSHNQKKNSDTALEQHGYLLMQYTKVLGSLSDQYGHIFRTELGEVNFADVVINRRILVVLLPALEKSPDALTNLGKIIIASMKSMMASGLGSRLEGTRRQVIETKPTASITPFMAIMDEYGYYAVNGFAVVAAQARSLGFSAIFAGQDLPAFQKASKEEAASIVANCNVKLCGKLEDPAETWELFKNRGGEADTTKTSGYNMDPGNLTGGYMDMNNVSLERRHRIDLLDLVDQSEGETHILWRSTIVRAKMFYASPKLADEYRLNHFIKVKPPKPEDLLMMDEEVPNFIKRLSDPEWLQSLPETPKSVEIDIVSKIMEKRANMEGTERGICALVEFDRINDEKIEAFAKMAERLSGGGEDDGVEANAGSGDVTDLLPTGDGRDDETLDMPSVKRRDDPYLRKEDNPFEFEFGSNDPAPKSRPLDADGIEPPADDEEFSALDLFKGPSVTDAASFAEGVFSDPVMSGMVGSESDLNPYLDEDQVARGVEKIERLSGTPREEAKQVAVDTVKQIKEITTYPKPPALSPLESDDLIAELNKFHEIMEQSIQTGKGGGGDLAILESED